MTRENSLSPFILVIEDEALIRWSLSEGLAEFGYVVRLAATGAEARAALTSFRNQPLVVVLDLRLPDVADLSLLADIRARRPDAPVIMTAYGRPKEAQEAKTLGVAAFVGKPFDVGDMIRAIGAAWLQRPLSA